MGTSCKLDHFLNHFCFSVDSIISQIRGSSGIFKQALHMYIYRQILQSYTVANHFWYVKPIGFYDNSTRSTNEVDCIKSMRVLVDKFYRSGIPAWFALGASHARLVLLSLHWSESKCFLCGSLTHTKIDCGSHNQNVQATGLLIKKNYTINTVLATGCI